MANSHNDQTRLRTLTKILAVQEKYKAVKKERMTLVYIHYHYIEPEFYIAYSTFYKYLAINAKKEIRLLKEKIENERSLNNSPRRD